MVQLNQHASSATRGTDSWLNPAGLNPAFRLKE